MTDLNVKLIDLAHRVLFERGPVSDPHVEIFRRQCERDAAMREREREDAERREDEAQRACGGRSAEEYFMAEQCPSDRHLGR